MNTSLLAPLAWLFGSMTERAVWSFEMRLTSLSTPVEVSLYALPDSFVGEDFVGVKLADEREFTQVLLHKLGFPAVSDADWTAGWWCSVLALEWLPMIGDESLDSGHINRAWLWLGYDEHNRACEYRWLWTNKEQAGCAAQMLAASVVDERHMSTAQRDAYHDVSKVLAAAIEFMGKAATDFDQWQQASQLQAPVSVADYVSLLQLLNPNASVDEVATKASRLYQQLVVNGGVNEGDLAADLFVDGAVWRQDWKCDAEGLAAAMAGLLGVDDFELPAPAGVLGEDLFPYVQAALEPYAMQLMNYQSFSDHYDLFLLPSYQVATVLKLSDLTACDLERL